MHLYLDSAEVTAWADLMPTGLFRGITTNPLLAQRAGLVYPEIDWTVMAERARSLGARELHAQVYGPPESYLDWVGALYEVGQKTGIRTVAKIPLTDSAIRTVPKIKKLGGPILMTAAYHPKQMCVAAALGADFIAPYFGRMQDAGIDATDAVAQMLAIRRVSDPAPRILVASLRRAEQVSDLAARGLDCFTLSPAVAAELLTDPLTLAAAAEFEAAAAAS